MIRGELWTVAGGVYASKPRPALIIQDDLFAGTESVTVLPLTGALIDAPLLRVRVGPGELSGLTKESDIMIDKATTVRRQNVDARIGRLSADQMTQVERLLMVFFGMAR
ncbi:type II toxin-antitoxin system PemK/MazF family toxin [Microbacterium sp. NPDC089698]|uniref:type II toxin-antitoxin system PemK/MazF family toxin n=1 Tax=Microbacterium sp. NPDC089698 TaxID=3364200 RepID=UPI0037F6336B